MTQTECSCEVPEKGAGAIFCKRHECDKSRRMVQLCQMGARGEEPGLGYWRAWEEGGGPRQKQSEPGVVRKAASYTKAVAKHAASGFKKRSPEEIERIYTTICEPCEFYNPEEGGCRVCGCRVGRGKRALFNKIAMASQHCPKGKW